MVVWKGSREATACGEPSTGSGGLQVPLAAAAAACGVSDQGTASSAAASPEVGSVAEPSQVRSGCNHHRSPARTSPFGASLGLGQSTHTSTTSAAAGSRSGRQRVPRMALETEQEQHPSAFLKAQRWRRFAGNGFEFPSSFQL